MMGYLLAGFEDQDDVLAVARRAWQSGHPAMDVLCHKPIDGLCAYLAPPHGKPPIGWIMFIAAVLGAAAGYFMQWFSAVLDYPIDSGGRPLNSWPAFLLVPYEAAILLAAVVGVLAWLWFCGLPKLFHPLFDAPLTERASQDCFVLVFPDDPDTRQWAKGSGLRLVEAG
jgi:Protein of unknown function (DUF3341)